ncbi:MAG: VOC family protein [Myxococcales bacterium]|nr:VOC family protein [Myxococcales bacterium]
MESNPTFTLTRAGDRELHGERRFAAPRELLFRAFTEPALLLRWMHTPCAPMTRAELDPRPGGRLRYEWSFKDGERAGEMIGLTGAIVECTPPARLVHTERFDQDWTDGEVTVTTRFDATGEHTTVHMIMRYPTAAAREAVLNTPMQEGMARTFEALDRLLEQLRDEPRAEATPAKLTPFLTFPGSLDEALAFYRGVFPDLRVEKELRQGAALFSATIELLGQRLVLLQGGPGFSFGNGVSLHIGCETQDEVDGYWRRLGDGGEPGRCGWLKDRFGVSWQVVPHALPRLMERGDPEATQRVVAAMMTMTKLEVAALEAAARGG